MLFRGPCQRVIDQIGKIGTKTPIVADHPQPHILARKFVEIVADEEPQQPHQIADFALRPPPILRREGVEREDVDPHRPAPHALRAAPPPPRLGGLRGVAGKRFFAQRPLPSMMMATWRGTASPPPISVSGAEAGSGLTGP